MEAAKWIVNILHIIFAISIIIIVLLQSGKQAGLSGSIAGGAETFFGKNKVVLLMHCLESIQLLLQLHFSLHLLLFTC